MSSPSEYDTIVYNESAEPSMQYSQVPFIKKKLTFQMDESPQDYNSNQVVYNTINIANSGQWNALKNAYVSLPTVSTLSRSAHHEGAPVRSFGLMMKSGPSLLDSYALEMNNGTIIQQRKNIHGYVSFKQHTRKSYNDLLTDSTGYFKPNRSVAYNAVRGITSREFAAGGVDHSHFPKPTVEANGNLNLGLVSAANMRSTAEDYSEVDGDTTIFYTEQIIYLRDLFFFDECPLLRGSTFKLTLTLNQCHITTTHVAGVPTVINSVLRGSSCPIMRTNVTLANAHDFDEVVTCNVVRFGNYQHQKNHCRLYVESFELDAAHETQLAELTKVITYTDVFVTTIRNQMPGSFQHILTNSISRLKRLIVMPMLSASGNGNLASSTTPQNSLYTNEPACCSPYYISNYNVALSGINVYQSDVTFKYEHFLSELNRKFAPNAGLVDSQNGSLISLKDFQSNMGYLVTDLSRRSERDLNVPLSVQISGNIESPKPLDFLIYLEFEKSVTVRLVDGSTVE